MQNRFSIGIASTIALLTVSFGSSALACGIQTAGLQPGTPLQMLTAPRRDHPWLRINHPAIVATRLVSAPCHGRLVETRPLGFRYTASPGFSGNDTFAFLGCTATGQCVMNGAVITVTP